MIIRHKNILSVFRAALLVLFLGYYSNITMFYHSHLVDGRIITHSHWFNDFDNQKPVNSHAHSSQEYIHIHLLNCASMDNDLAVPFLSNPVCMAAVINTTAASRYFYSDIPAYPRLRAPPAC